MRFTRTGFAGIAGLALAACSAGEDGGRSAAKLTEIEWTVQSSGQTAIGQVEIGYQGGHVKDVSFRENGADAGRMEFRYGGDRVQGIDLVDAQGDQGSYAWNYDDDRLTSILYSVPQVVSHEQRFEYDDAANGRARRTTSTTTWVGSAPSSMVETYDYDDDGRLEEISAVQGTSTWSYEIRYDDESRIERFTQYVGSNFTESDLTYDDQGRLSMVETDDNDRYELTYDAEGRIDEIFVLAPGSGETMTVTYRYEAGTVAGLTFNPNLPLAGMIDLRGMPFDQPSFTALAPSLQLGDVPAPEPPASCTHDVCDVGAALDGSCDSCAATVCAQDSFCCTSSWDGTCVQNAENLCGISCGDTAGCSHDVCVQGAALDSSCSSCASSVCAQDSFCCSSSWDATCVGYVPSVCGISC